MTHCLEFNVSFMAEGMILVEQYASIRHLNSQIWLVAIQSPTTLVHSFSITNLDISRHCLASKV